MPGVNDITLEFTVRSIRPHLVIFAGVIGLADSEMVYAESGFCWASDQSELAAGFETWRQAIVDGGFQLVYVQAQFVPSAIKGQS